MEPFPSSPDSFGPSLIIGGMVLIIAIVIIAAIVRYLANATQQILSVRARLVAKRADVSGGRNDTSVSTSYYLTFETIQGSRMELSVSGTEYGLLAEGDEGILTYQGEWFKGFQRGQTVV